MTQTTVQTIDQALSELSAAPGISVLLLKTVIGYGVISDTRAAIPSMSRPLAEIRCAQLEPSDLEPQSYLAGDGTIRTVSSSMNILQNCRSNMHEVVILDEAMTNPTLTRTILRQLRRENAQMITVVIPAYGDQASAAEALISEEMEGTIIQTIVHADEDTAKAAMIEFLREREITPALLAYVEANPLNAKYNGRTLVFIDQLLKHENVDSRNLSALLANTLGEDEAERLEKALADFDANGKR